MAVKTKSKPKVAKTGKASKLKRPEATEPLSPELGAITHFEHVNFRVPDHRMATLFFMEGLGFTRDPTRMVGVNNMWVNIGRQQIHLPLGEAIPFPGVVGLTVPDLKTVRDGLVRIAPMLKGTAFELAEDKGTLRVTSPWGHRLRVHPAGSLSGRYPQAIPYVAFDVPPGAAQGIAAFYSEVLDTPSAVSKNGKRRTATVPVGTHQFFHFSETKDYAPVAHPNHVAVYVTRYNKLYRAVQDRGLVMRPHAREQFRFEKMADPETGNVVFSFEHEVRSLYHPDYLKPLTNRVPVPYLVD